jgi:hypothetical protein
MFVLDSLLISGLRFVLNQLLAAVDAELHDDSALRERLLEAQMRLELGELTDQEFADIEHDVLARLRELREEREGLDTRSGNVKVVGVEASVVGDDD